MRLRRGWSGGTWERRARFVLRAIGRDPARRRAALRVVAAMLPPTASRPDVADRALERAVLRGWVDLRARHGEPAPHPIPSRAERPADLEGPEVGVHWIEVQLVDMAGDPVPGERYELRFPGGVRRGRLDAEGRARIPSLEKPGTCELTFPDLDQDAWEQA